MKKPQKNIISVFRTNNSLLSPILNIPSSVFLPWTYASLPLSERCRRAVFQERWDKNVKPDGPDGVPFREQPDLNSTGAGKCLVCATSVDNLAQHIPKKLIFLSAFRQIHKPFTPHLFMIFTILNLSKCSSPMCKTNAQILPAPVGLRKR